MPPGPRRARDHGDKIASAWGMPRVNEWTLRQSNRSSCGLSANDQAVYRSLMQCPSDMGRVPGRVLGFGF